MKVGNEGSINNGTYAWHKLDTEIADSYSPPVVENSDVPDLQRNRVSNRAVTIFLFAFFFRYVLNVYVLNFIYRHLKNYELYLPLSLLINRTCFFIDVSMLK